MQGSEGKLALKSRVEKAAAYCLFFVTLQSTFFFFARLKNNRCFMRLVCV